MTTADAIWVDRVAALAGLPDRRLQSRLIEVLADVLESPPASIPCATGGHAGEAKATYRFYSNSRVASAKLNRGFSLETAGQCLEQATVLFVQDSTSLNFTGLHRIPELGPIDSGGLARGLHLHSTLAVSTTGKVLGIMDLQCWARPQPTPANARKKVSAEKESAKWINGIENARAALYEAAEGRPLPRIIHVMDREGDAYEVMMAVEDAGDSAIIRCAQNRCMEDSLVKAHEAVRNQPVLRQTTLAVRRKKNEPAREARVELRSLSAHLRPNYQKHPHAWSMRWNLVEVWEVDPPPGVERLHWLLWTREMAATADDALEVMRKYTCRWPIEEMHLVLKSGCQVEKLRLETWERLEKAIRINASVAARIVMLRDLAKKSPETPALTVVSADEAAALVSRFGKDNSMSPAQLTIGQAVLWIARLGGHLNRKRDGMPGVRTLWRGLQALTLLVDGFHAGFRAALLSSSENKCG